MIYVNHTPLNYITQLHESDLELGPALWPNCVKVSHFIIPRLIK